ncbi:MAG TPA: phage holin family protein [Opitutaceae bacterium]|nr:phage holin family protein [Opitutaceae bacterium]
MNHPVTQLLLRWAVLALGVVIATKIIPGIHYVDASSLVVVVLLLSFFNAILKPVLVLFTLPFIVVTLGFGMVVINALLFLLVSHLVNGFEVRGFWSAVGGALVVSVTNLVASRFVRRATRKRAEVGGATPPTPFANQHRRDGRRKSDDVIDI